MKTPPLEVRFVRLLAQRLHEYGAGAHRLEGAVKTVAQSLKLEVGVFSTPTSMFLSFRREGAGSDDMLSPTQLLRLKPGEDDLGRLCTVDAIGDAVSNAVMTVQQGWSQLQNLEHQQRDPIALVLTAWAVVGMASVGLLGGNWTDIGLGAGLAILTGIFSMNSSRLAELGSFEPIAAFVVTVLAHLLTSLLGGGNAPLIVVGALIVLMPGLSLTMAVTELSTGHLASGTARFAGAVIRLVKLALGVVLATQLMTAAGFTDDNSTSGAIPPDWFTWPSILLTAIAFGVLFKARRPDYPIMGLAGVLAFSVNGFVGHAWGADVGVFFAALAVAASSNLYSRIFRMPASVMRLPGVILLVPGSLGYRSLTLMFSENVNDGLTAAVSVVTVLAALVGGLLLGNTVIPPRRHL